ncbi:hypothetical protein BV22DRAFT_1045207 [Leucogyrophana mollusca]|uniref:Uncharacterized protein n=1 Tax=Leucogyrophana mollusca TaxID=85980 RepID=A0ACB8BQ38_9AGAM|nr:hypothetical protein BV22DRAFT_1045207 [Leucogyrophana mollusca]
MHEDGITVFIKHISPRFPNFWVLTLHNVVSPRGVYQVFSRAFPRLTVTENGNPHFWGFAPVVAVWPDLRYLTLGYRHIWSTSSFPRYYSWLETRKRNEGILCGFMFADLKIANIRRELGRNLAMLQEYGEAFFSWKGADKPGITGNVLGGIAVIQSHKSTDDASVWICIHRGLKYSILTDTIRCLVQYVPYVASGARARPTILCWCQMSLFLRPLLSSQKSSNIQASTFQANYHLPLSVKLRRMSLAAPIVALACKNGIPAHPCVLVGSIYFIVRSSSSLTIEKVVVSSAKIDEYYPSWRVKKAFQTSRQPESRVGSRKQLQSGWYIPKPLNHAKSSEPPCGTK